MINNNYSNEVNNILELYNNKKISEYNLNDKSDLYKKDLINNLLKRLKYKIFVNSQQNYKMEYYYELYEYLIKNYYNIFLNDKSLLFLLLTKLVVLNKGYILIFKFKKKIDNMFFTILELSELLWYTASNGTPLIFIYLIKIILNNKNITINTDLIDEIKKINNGELLNKLLINSITNSDDRIYKIILNSKNISNILNNNTTLILSLLSFLGKALYIPPKYKLKRLKLLSENVNLNNYFFDMITYFDTKSIKILHNYYYINTNNIYSIDKIYTLMNNSDCICCEYDNILNIFKTEYEKILYIILCSIKFNYYKNYNYNKILFKEIIKNNYEYICNILYTSINWSIFINKINENINNQILKILCDNNLITKYFIINKTYLYTYDLSNIRLINFTKFLPIYNNFNIGIYIKNNYLLHNLRLYVKKKRNNKIIKYKYNMLNILNDINNYIPNYNIIINNFKLNNYKIINLIDYEKNKYNYIKNNIIPYDHYPYSNILNIYDLNLDYIENDDIYVINDINITNDINIINRYNILLQQHKNIKNKNIYSISNMEQYNLYLNEYKNNYNEFINSYDNNYIKWFPNFICIIK